MKKKPLQAGRSGRKRILGLLPIERVIFEDSWFAHVFPSGRKLAGAQGNIPPRAGHHEAMVLSSGRVRKNSVGPGEITIQFWAKGSGDGRLAEARQPLRNPRFLPPMRPALGGIPPWACAIESFSSFLPTRLGEDPEFSLSLDKQEFYPL